MLLCAQPHHVGETSSQKNVTKNFNRVSPLGNHPSALTFAGLLLGPAAASGALVSVSISTSDMLTGWTCSDVQTVLLMLLKRSSSCLGLLLAAARQLQPWPSNS
jgi:hypothetical protein